MRGAAAGRSEVEFARIGLGVFHELVDGLDIELWMHNQYVRHEREHRNRHEILFELVAAIVIQRFANRVVNGADQVGVSVGCCLGRNPGTQRAGRATQVLDEYALADRGADLGRHWPREYIGTTAGGERVDPFHRFVGPCLCGR